MVSSGIQILLEKEAEIMLLNPPTDIQEFIVLLENVRRLLANVDEKPSISMKDALEPLMNAFIADELLRHPDNDVRVFVASCISEIIKISAPDAPYSDEIMKEIFQLFVATFENLSNESGPCYRKALSILDNIAETKLCLLMLDLECEALIIKTFRIVLKVIRWNHPYSLFTSMADIMIQVIDESEDVSWDLLSTLLASVKKENQGVSPNSWKLGENILTNCTAKLKPYLVEALQSRGLALNEYSEIVTNICNGEIVQFYHLNGIEEQLRDHLKRNAEHLRMMYSAAAKSSNTDGTYSKEIPETRVKRKQTAQREARMLYSAIAKSSNTDETCSKEIPKTEVKRKRISQREARMLYSALAKSSNTDETCSKEIPKTEVKRKRTTQREARMIYSAGAKSSNTDVTCSKEIPKTRVKRKRTAQREPRMMYNAVAKSSNMDGTFSKEIPKTGVKRKQTAQRKADSERYCHAKDLVLMKVKVWWPLDKTFYEGVLDSYDYIEEKHRILYEDGDEEKLNLNDELWKPVGGVNLPRGGQETDVFKPDASSESGLQKHQRNTKFDTSMSRNFSKASSSLERRFQKQETDMEFEPSTEICFALKALSPSKRAKAPTIASEPKLIKSSGSLSLERAKSSRSESKEVDVSMHQSPQVIMTASEDNGEFLGYDKHIGEYFNNLVPIIKEAQKGISCNDVKSVKYKYIEDYLDDWVTKNRKSSGESDGSTSDEEESEGEDNEIGDETDVATRDRLIAAEYQAVIRGGQAVIEDGSTVSRIGADESQEVSEQCVVSSVHRGPVGELERGSEQGMQLRHQANKV